MEERFQGRPWGSIVKRSADGKRIWLYGEELGGTDIEEEREVVPGGGQDAIASPVRRRTIRSRARRIRADSRPPSAELVPSAAHMKSGPGPCILVIKRP